MAPEPTSEEPPRSIAARVLAPLALAAVVVAFAAVVSSSLSGSEDGGRDQRPRAEREQPTKFDADVYVVEPGDTLSGIAERTGVPIRRLERLNPEIDPEALGTGQTIKLR